MWCGCKLAENRRKPLNELIFKTGATCSMLLRFEGKNFFFKKFNLDAFLGFGSLSVFAPAWAGQARQGRAGQGRARPDRWLKDAFR